MGYSENLSVTLGFSLHVAQKAVQAAPYGHLSRRRALLNVHVLNHYSGRNGHETARFVKGARMDLFRVDYWLGRDPIKALRLAFGLGIDEMPGAFGTGCIEKGLPSPKVGGGFDAEVAADIRAKA